MRFLQVDIFFARSISQHFRRFTRVAAWLLHRGYGLHPHKIRDDRYSTSHLEITSASFVLGVFCELRLNGVLRSSCFGRSRKSISKILHSLNPLPPELPALDTPHSLLHALRFSSS